MERKRAFPEKPARVRAPPMNQDSSFDLLPPTLREALLARGFTSLTSVQQAVIDPALKGRDLRISSQTGSGKTVAIGIVLHPLLQRVEATEQTERTDQGACRPTALVVVPTRELAAQVCKELEWFLTDGGARILSVTGGTSIGAELRGLRRGAELVVATPGRLLDHLERGSIDPRGTKAIVLDEADQMLDLGFRDELEKILEKLPSERRTLLVSATFSREVISLASRYQRDAVGVEGTRLGEANVDIAHVVHVISPSQREDVVVNLLLMAPDETTLVFVRTRADGTQLASKLAQLGFAAASLTGDMEQQDRTRTLESFRSGALKTLVATDVAARGIDTDVTRVIHADPPGDADSYTHRSGRTGRAGRKGISIMLIPPAAREHAVRIHRRARVDAKWGPPPSAEEVTEVVDAQLIAALSTDTIATPTQRGGTDKKRLQAIADKLLETNDPAALIARLLERVRFGGLCAPRKIAVVDNRPPASSLARPRFESGQSRMGTPPRHRDSPVGRAPRSSAVSASAKTGAHARFADDSRASRHPEGNFGTSTFGSSAHSRQGGELAAPSRAEVSAPFSTPSPRASVRGSAQLTRVDEGEPAEIPRREIPPSREGKSHVRVEFVPFRVNWGEQQGADARRILAMVCRRGGIRGKDVGAIEIGASESLFEVSNTVAEEFTRSMRRPDPRDPRIRIEPLIRAHRDDVPRGEPPFRGGAARMNGSHSPRRATSEASSKSGNGLRHEEKGVNARKDPQAHNGPRRVRTRQA
ncbi:MAG: hypothetical protein NVS3B20_07970 [Polyangiales bacterium]